jgi:hypothetical protein
MPLTVVEISKRYRENNREKYNQYQKEYRLNNTDKFNKEYHKKKYAQNKEKYKANYNLNKNSLCNKRILNKEIKIFNNILLN